MILGIEQELERMTDVAKKEIPLLSEIRIFGSYNNGNWNPRTSDVDVFLEIDDEHFSGSKDRIYYEHHSVESEQRQTVREKILGAISEDFAWKYKQGLKIFSKGDVRDLGANITGEMKAGRLLYPVNLPVPSSKLNISGLN